MSRGGAVLLLLACDPAVPEREVDSGECTITTWEEFLDQFPVAKCQYMEACYGSEFRYDSLADCEVLQRSLMDGLPEGAERAGCGPFVPDQGCLTVACNLEAAGDCGADCEYAGDGSGWFEPPCDFSIDD